MWFVAELLRLRASVGETPNNVAEFTETRIESNHDAESQAYEYEQHAACIVSVLSPEDRVTN
jgi:hypothetical protein